MYRKSILHQTKFLLKQKEAVLTLIFLLWLVIGNYVWNVTTFRGLDITRMYHPMKLLALSYNRTHYSADLTLLIVMLYPFLVVLPAGFSYVNEQQTREEIFLVSRLGKRRYVSSRVLAAFLATFAVFTLPFLIEIAMNCLSFPLKAQNDLSNLSIYDAQYADMVHRYLGTSIYLISPVLYAVCGTLLFGVLSGILSMFLVSFSFLLRTKYRVVLFLPVFLLLNGTTYLDRILYHQKNVYGWPEYLFLFSDSPKNVWYFAAAIALLLAATAVFSYLAAKKETF